VLSLGIPFFALAFIAARLAWNVGRPGPPQQTSREPA
jgi:hypothetical protein